MDTGAPNMPRSADRPRGSATRSYDAVIHHTDAIAHHIARPSPIDIQHLQLELELKHPTSRSRASSNSTACTRNIRFNIIIIAIQHCSTSRAPIPTSQGGRQRDLCGGLPLSRSLDLESCEQHRRPQHEGHVLQDRCHRADRLGTTRASEATLFAPLCRRPLLAFDAWYVRICHPMPINRIQSNRSNPIDSIQSTLFNNVRTLGDGITYQHSNVHSTTATRRSDAIVAISSYRPITCASSIPAPYTRTWCFNSSCTTLSASCRASSACVVDPASRFRRNTRRYACDAARSRYSLSPRDTDSNGTWHSTPSLASRRSRPPSRPSIEHGRRRRRIPHRNNNEHRSPSEAL